MTTRRVGRSGGSAPDEGAAPSRPGPPPAATGFAELFPGDPTFVECRVCHDEFADIERHFIDDHPQIPIEVYQAEFPDAPMRGAPATQRLPDTRITVSAAEAEKHPGGREAVVIQKSLDQAERRGYQDDVAGLITQGFPKGHLLATTAYLMVLERRARHDIETKRGQTKSAVFAGESFDLMTKLSAQITANLKSLETMRANRTEVDDPMGIIDKEMAEAELFVRQHIGEFTEACPHCSQLLTPPGLPHWAFERMETSNGVEFPVWSSELWRLVCGGVIPIWVMAFTLRTSPEGLRVTAQRRGETWPDTIVLEVEERALRQEIEARDLEQMVTAIAPSAQRAEEREDTAGASSSPDAAPPEIVSVTATDADPSEEAVPVFPPPAMGA